MGESTMIMIADHLVMVLISMNSSSMCACILIKGVTSNIDVILHDQVELPHVPLVMVLRMVSKVPSVAHKSKSHY